MDSHSHSHSHSHNHSHDHEEIIYHRRLTPLERWRKYLGLGTTPALIAGVVERII